MQKLVNSTKSYLFIDQAIYSFSNYIFLLLIARLIGPESLSVYAVILSLSYLFKNVLILLSVIIFIYLNRKKITPAIKKDYKQVKSEITQVNKKKDHLKSIKEKGELKTEYQRILEGTDEKD